MKTPCLRDTWKKNSFRLFRLWAIATIAVFLVTPAAVRAQQQISIPSVTPTTLASLLRHEAPPTMIAGELYMPPQGTGPVPAVVLKHGSGGLAGPTGANIRKWAGILNSWGVAALVVDSFGPRGIIETSTNQAQLSTWADVADAFAGLKALGADPRFDKTRIGIIGWSRGGSVAFNTALESARKAVIADDLKFALHISFYGAAMLQYRDRATDLSPILFLHGESDNYVPIGPTREFANWIQSMGNPVTFISYPGTYHDFDVETVHSGFNENAEVSARCDLVTDLSDGRVTRMRHQDNPTKASLDDIRAYMSSCIIHGANLAYNPSARADAIENVQGFLQQYFKLSR